MQYDNEHRYHLSREELANLDETNVNHPLNPASDVYLKRLAPIFGLERLALYIARVPPVKESFLYHRHEKDEEFLVILSGRGRAEIGECVVHVGPGDIMGFPAPDGPPHHLSNPFEEDLIYIMGGESSAVDIAHFPRTGDHLVFSRSGIWSFSERSSRKLTFADWLADSEE